jgi:hypothetical protein
VSVETGARRHLEREARALLVRLGRLKPFALHETMVPAASPSLPAQTALERYLARGRQELRGRVAAFLSWMRGAGRGASPEQIQRRLVFLRLRFNVVLSDFDLFADVLTQRSEYETGPWLAGLDVVATDALTLSGFAADLPPVICYLDRGHGAAIRRARTRLPGGGDNPVAIVRIPRERMVGAGIASSLVHEVGHQAAALFDLTNTARAAVQAARVPGGADDAAAWTLWERWISEIIADVWAIARIGVGSTTGLMTIVSLPRAFVFHVGGDDPHPIPWVRVRLSCAIGAALYPDPQWQRLATLWAELYPLESDLTAAQRTSILALERTMPAFVQILLGHRPAAFGGRTLFDALRGSDRTPEQLRRCHRTWQNRFRAIREAPPSLAFAVLAQARADETITPELESRLSGDLLTYWALRQALQTHQFAAVHTQDPRTVAAS